MVMVLLGSSLAWPKPIRPEAPPDFSKLKEESIKKWSGAEVLLTGKLSKVIAGPVGLSDPPLRTYQIHIEPDKILRGQPEFPKQLVAGFAIKQSDPPTFPKPGQECVIALKFLRDAWELVGFDTATPDSIEQAKLATSFPMGWTIKGGKLVSPWAKVGAPNKAEGVACSVTGRPVLLVGDTVRFSVEPVEPVKKVEFANPDGDGEFKLIVKNVSDREVEVPAVLTDGKSIRWNEAIVIISDGNVLTLPGATANLTGLKPVVLKPRETVTGKIHTFAVPGINWPNGGSRVELQFCLGERSATHSFYYLFRHHDPIREAIEKSLKK